MELVYATYKSSPAEGAEVTEDKVNVDEEKVTVLDSPHKMLDLIGLSDE